MDDQEETVEDVVIELIAEITEVQAADHAGVHQLVCPAIFFIYQKIKIC